MSQEQGIFLPFPTTDFQMSKPHPTAYCETPQPLFVMPCNPLCA